LHPVFNKGAAQSRTAAMKAPVRKPRLFDPVFPVKEDDRPNMQYSPYIKK
jgi:hypothetical protein